MKKCLSLLKVVNHPFGSSIRRQADTEKVEALALAVEKRLELKKEELELNAKRERLALDTEIAFTEAKIKAVGLMDDELKQLPTANSEDKIEEYLESAQWKTASLAIICYADDGGNAEDDDDEDNDDDEEDNEDDTLQTFKPTSMFFTRKAGGCTTQTNSLFTQPRVCIQSDLLVQNFNLDFDFPENPERTDLNNKIAS